MVQCGGVLVIHGKRLYARSENMTHTHLFILIRMEEKNNTEKKQEKYGIEMYCVYRILYETHWRKFDAKYD